MWSAYSKFKTLPQKLRCQKCAGTTTFLDFSEASHCRKNREPKSKFPAKPSTVHQALLEYNSGTQAPMYGCRNVPVVAFIYWDKLGPDPAGRHQESTPF